MNHRNRNPYGGRGAAAALPWVAVVMLAGIAGARGLPDGDREASLQVGPLTRHYRYHLPPGYDRSRPMPAVIALHGGGGDAGKTEKFTQGCFNDLGDTEGFIVVYPNAVKYPRAKLNWNDGRGYQEFPAQRDDVDDVGFISALIDRLAEDLGADRRRTYVTGPSNGGIMSNRLACELSGKIAAAAPVIASLAAGTVTRCSPARRIPILMINGTKDPLLPWDGGDVRFGRRRMGKVISVPETLKFWVAHNGCDPAAQVSLLEDKAPDDGSRVRRHAYGGCKEGAEVLLYAVEGAGHTWPGGYQYAPRFMVGTTNQDIDACQVIWQFFKRHSL